MLYTQLVWKD